MDPLPPMEQLFVYTQLSTTQFKFQGTAMVQMASFADRTRPNPVPAATRPPPGVV